MAEERAAKAEESGSRQFAQDHGEWHRRQLLPGQPFGYGVEESEDEPTSDNLIMSILSILFCPPFGLLAVSLSMMARRRLQQGKRHEAFKIVIWARRFCFSGMMIGIIYLIMYLTILLVKRPHRPPGTATTTTVKPGVTNT